MQDYTKLKSFSEAAKFIGIPYYNRYAKKKVIAFFQELNINIENIILNNREKKVRYCLNCGKVLTSGLYKFCSNSCSASYLNKGRHLSKETKSKISKSLKARYERQNKDILRSLSGIIKYKHVCQLCGNVFYSHKRDARFCSLKCISNSIEVREKLRKAQLLKVINGEHKGWKSRNVTSYAENFWICVLNNNNISYIREDHSNGKYFLDFLIKRNNKLIDLEIDGKLHKYTERAISDKNRDLFLSSLGYVVYRVQWNEINTEKGKLEMQNKVNAFLEFYARV